MWKRSVELSRYAVGGLWGLKSPGIEAAGAGGGDRRARGWGTEGEGRVGVLRQGLWVSQVEAGADGYEAPLERGHRSGCDTTEPVMAGRGASEHLDAPHRTESTVGTET